MAFLKTAWGAAVAINDKLFFSREEKGGALKQKYYSSHHGPPIYSWEVPGADAEKPPPPPLAYLNTWAPVLASSPVQPFDPDAVWGVAVFAVVTSLPLGEFTGDDETDHPSPPSSYARPGFPGWGLASRPT